MRRFAALVSLLLVSAAAGQTNAPAAEVIEDFSSRVDVRGDGTLDVTETIRVTPQGDRIKHGIYRDFPTLYSGKAGLRTKVPFEVLEVLRDGRPEPWRDEKHKNGIRIYLGSSNVLLPHKATTYTIRYRTDRQLGFFRDHDELYWNVTGNGWAFPILHASVCVKLPPGAKTSSQEAYTGRAGEKGTAWRVKGSTDCDAAMETTGLLGPGEGFTIAVTWPKGFVTPPSAISEGALIFASNPGLILGSAGLLAVLIYFLIAWNFFGRDPEHGVIIPLYAPPDELSPQEVRFLNGLGTCDNTSLTSAVMHLAVHRLITITEEPKGVFTLHKSVDGTPKAGGDGFFNALFAGSSSLRLVNTNHARIGAARTALGHDLNAALGKLFRRNTGIWVVGLLAMLIPLGVSLMDAPDAMLATFMMIWLSIWSVGCAALSMSVVSAWRSGRRLTAVPLAVFSIPFLGCWFFGMWALLQAASPLVCALYVCGIILCSVFQTLLKQPTREGQEIRDRILGFKQYLSVAEAERLGLENPPERTPELFEKFLPYALALGVEQAWSEKFAGVLSEAGRRPDDGSPHRPVSLVLPAAASAFAGALSSAISSASTAPGSSSGSGGGGSSGGGGGGGGGGGW